MLRTSFFVVSAIFLFIFFLLVSNKEDGYKKAPLEKRMEARAEQEVMMTKDPNTGLIPREELFKAKKEILKNLKNQERSVNDLFWTERGPDNFAGRVRKFVIDPDDPSGNTIWAGGVAGGLWQCTNAFELDYEWRLVSSYTGNVGVSSIIFDPENSDIMYVGTGEAYVSSIAYTGDGIYKSIDHGVTWNRLPSTENGNFQFTQDMLIAEGRLFACTFANGIMMSDDGGETWLKSLGNGQFGFSNRANQVELAANGDLYASMGLGNSEDGIYKSIDNGNTWSFLNQPVSQFQRIEIAVAPSDANVIYAMYENGQGGIDNIWKSLDGGNTWEGYDAPTGFNLDNFARNQAWYDMAINVHPNDHERVMVGAVDPHYSGNSGENWTQVGQWFGGGGFPFVHADQHYILPVPGSDRVLLSNDGGIYVSENGFSDTPNFLGITRGFNITQFYSCAIHPEAGRDYFLGGTQDNGSHIFVEEGVNSTFEITGGDGGFCFIDQDNPDIQITSFTFNSYNVTQNNWGTRRFFGSEDTEGSFINPCDYDDKFNRLYARGEQDFLNIIDVDSEEFIQQFIPGLGSPFGFKVHPVNDHELWVFTTDGKIKKVSNLDSNPLVEEFIDVPGVGRSIEFHPEDPNKMIATVSNFGVASVYFSGNGGISWTSCEGNLPNMPVRWAVFHPDLPQGAFIATELGVWSTETLNGESTVWTISDVLPLTRVDMLEIREEDNMLIAATHGRGMWTAEIDFEIVDLDGDGFFSDVDCDDSNPEINPNSVEIVYNGIDDDCDSFTLDDDLDFDGFGIEVDCDDQDPNINPGTVEIDDNGIDENCDGLDFAVGCTTFTGGPFPVMQAGGQCADAPIQGYAVWSNESYNVNDMIDGQAYVVQHCENYDPTIFESRLTVVYYDRLSGNVGTAIETAVGCHIEFVYEALSGFPDILIIISEIANCDAPSIQVDNGVLTIACIVELLDNDGDGFFSDVDCDDENAEINPDQIELAYNGIDDDCDPSTLDDDLDEDGFGLAEDCDDTNDLINPDAEDIIGNGIDENCDGVDGVSAIINGVEAEVSVFPNPTYDKIFMESNIEGLSYELFDVRGKRVESGVFGEEVDLSNFASGAYLMKLATNKNEQVAIQWIVKI